MHLRVPDLELIDYATVPEFDRLPEVPIRDERDRDPNQD